MSSGTAGSDGAEQDAAAVGPDDSYPGPGHLLRHLPLELEVPGGPRGRAQLSVGDPLLEDSGGQRHVIVGVLTTVVDVLAGAVVGRLVAPDWMATAELSLHLAAPLPPGEVVLEAEAVREGRTTVVVDVAVHHSEAGLAGEALVTFVRLPRREGNLDIGRFAPTPGERRGFGDAGEPPRHHDEIVRRRVVDARAGATRTEVDDTIRNSFGAVNGGVVAGVAELAGRTAAEAAVGSPAVTLDLAVHYLAQARTGPLTTAARVLRSGPGGAVSRVEVADGDEAPRTCAIAHVTTGPAAP